MSYIRLSGLYHVDDEEDDDEAIIRDSSRKGKGVQIPLHYYNIYLTYSTYYFKVPRRFISGFDGATNLPLHPPTVMFEDIAPDYREKTVMIEPSPSLETPLQMASVHLANTRRP
ncbi:hypothetical protein FN846DRAFT_912211 [Sphaerosporella brunnea]|uniref:Uncharacterized protein n=1 Tax=Sphaerosporella brunnea TaxID=1250544 RepID=A0A5J5EIF8_9PEZI|nr:hypothetical protein FN846DRAFT_912205 [Sphaerosporella brunnea]KAA8895034.1 hypothetical protein FN846DRAFT_912211 [Sphaerosporella brunnea]